MDGWRYDFGSFRSGLGLPSHKLCGDPTDMDRRGDALIQEGQAVATRLGLPLRITNELGGLIEQGAGRPMKGGGRRTGLGCPVHASGRFVLADN